ncbi:MAG: peptidylprolyl isomerase [Ignavibacteriaceae bacterium]
MSILLLPSFMLLAFTKISDNDDDTVIQINNYKIGFREFEDRLNDLPLPNASVYSLADLKENLACTLIAETILSFEAKKENLDTLSQIRLMSDEYHQEALYEQWMNSEVRDKVKISGDKIQKGYSRLKELRYVDYWAFPNKKKANLFRKEILKNSKTKLKPTLKKLEYGEALENVEDSVYSMKVGQVSQPIKVDSSYYVFRLVKKEKDPKYAKEDVAFYKSTIMERLKSKEELYRVSGILNMLMKDKGYSIETRSYKFLLRQLDPIIFNNDQQEPKTANLIQQELGAKKIKPDDMFKQPMIIFKDSKVWTVSKVWEKLAICPYPLNYDTPEQLEYGLQDVIKQIVLLESIVKDAQSKGYADSYYVKYQTQMWKNNLLAEALLNKFRKSIPISEKDLLAYYDTTKSKHMEPERRKIISIVVHDKKLAGKLYKQIEGGADMLTLAKKYSLNKLNLDEKNPGIYITPDSWGDAGKFAFTLKSGQIAAPKKVDDSTYAVIKLLEVKSAVPYLYDQIHDQLYSVYQDTKLQQLVDDFLLKVIKNYDIKINWAAMSKVEYFGGNMGVKKTHFPLRNAIPSFPFFNHNAKWFKEGVSKN